jgi:hypothetical protein
MEVLGQVRSAERMSRVMAKKPETLFKERIRPDLAAIPRTWFMKTQMLALLGIPDFILCINGYFVALELKKDFKSRTSKLQLYVLEKIVNAGGIAAVVSPENWDTIHKFLWEVSDGNINRRTFLDFLET